MFDKLIAELSAWPEIEAIALGGSRAGVHFDEKSDYDVYLYCTASIPDNRRKLVLEKYCSYMEIGNSFWEYEDNCTLKNGIDIDILYRNLDDFTAGLHYVVEQCNPYNGYTTCMWHNLHTCKILLDKNGRLTAVKQRFDIPYPEQLRENIIRRNNKLLEGTLPAYSMQIQKALNRGDLVSVNHRVSAFLESYFDIIFALNRQTHPGEKRMIQLCKENCAILPINFEQNLQELFSYMFTDAEKAADCLQRIVLEVRKLYE